MIDRATLRQVKGYSVDAFLAMFAGRVTVQTGAIVVGGFLGVVAAAHYSIAVRLVEAAKNLLRAVTATLAPAVSEREAQGDLDGVRRVLLGATRWVLYMVLPIHLGMLFFGRPFLARWVGGPQYADACFPAVAILSATLTVGVAQSVAARILYGLGRLRLFARMALVEAGLNLALSLALVGPFGLEGVAVAVAVPNVLFCVFVIAYCGRVLDVPVGRHLRAAWLRPVCAATVPAAVWWFVTPADPTWLAIGYPSFAASRARSSSSLSPRTRTTLLRLVGPPASSTCDRRSPSQSRSTPTTAAFARPSSGGAVTATFSAPACSPSTAFFRAFGWARTASVAPSRWAAIAIIRLTPRMPSPARPPAPSAREAGRR